MKQGSRCRKLKNESEFVPYKKMKDGLNSWCKKCREEYQKEKHYAQGGQPMAINKDCPCYLGIHIAEGLVAKYFKNPVRMPIHNKGYDFICSNGYKIDVKSSILTVSNQWLFAIKKNKIADYFLCLGFDNRHDLNLLHVWLFSQFCCKQ